MRKIVWVEVIGGQITRIFKNQKQALALCENPQISFKDEATGAIRQQVYSRQKGKCLDCGKDLPYKGSIYERFHMDEVVSKGTGGVVSLENCQGLCYSCHILGKHGDRRPRWSSQSE